MDFLRAQDDRKKCPSCGTRHRRRGSKYCQPCEAKADAAKRDNHHA